MSRPDAGPRWGPVRTLRWMAGLGKGHLELSGPRGVARLAAALPMSLFGGVYSRMGPDRRECACCEWHGANFLPYLAAGYVTFQAECPGCGWHPRHRGHRLFYDRVMHMMERQGKLLYFSPEHSILDYFCGNPRLDVKTTDFESPDADFRLNVMDIPFDDAGWDYVVCHRVIEHIPDDRLGLRELYRILKPGGTLILSVPITEEATLDHGAPNPLEDGHYYAYGPDFEQRIPAEFHTTRYDFSQLFDSGEFERQGLHEDYVFVCEKR